MPRIAKELNGEAVRVAVEVEGPRSRGMRPGSYRDRSHPLSQPSPLSREPRYKCSYCDRTSEDLSRWGENIEDG